MNSIDVAKIILEIKKVALSPNKIYKIADEIGLVRELGLNGKTPW